MDTVKPVKNLVTPVGRLAWPYVFVPQKNRITPGADPKYTITLLFPKTENITPLRELAKACAVVRWGADPSKWPQGENGFRIPIKDGDKKPQYQGFVNHWYISASSTKKIVVVDANMQEVIEPGKVYGGMYARANVNAFAYPGPKGPDRGNYGVSFGLLSLQLVRDGEPFVGMSSEAASKEFAPIEGGAEDPESYKGAGNVDPFATA